MNQRKIIALALTVLLPGLGYVYLGKKLWFGLLLITAGIGDIVWRATTPNGFRMNVFWAISLVAYWGAIFLDTYYTSLSVEAPKADIAEDDSYKVID